MGAISDYARGGSVTGGGRTDSRNLWDHAFRQTRGRPRQRPEGSQQPVPGGSWGRGVTGAGESALIRLLRAMRSNAPGGWTDDRYEQTFRHFNGITYVAIHRIGMQMARSEFQVYRRDDDHPDGKRPVTKHDQPTSPRYAEKGIRPYDLVELLQKPNRQDTWGKLAYRRTQQKMLSGMHLTWMVPNAYKTPMELYSIPTALAVSQPAVNPDFPDGFYRIQPVYPYGPFSAFPSPASSVGAPIGVQWVIRDAYSHPFLRYEGYSPLTALRLHIDAIEMIDRARHYMTRRGVWPSAVLNSADAEGSAELDDEAIEMIRAQFEADHQGPENMGRLFVAHAGWKLDQWGLPPSEMAFESGWEQLSQFILGGGFGISATAAGMVESSSYASLFAAMKQLHLVTLEPECVSYDTPLITRHGAGRIGDFDGQQVDVWNGKKWSRVTVKKMGTAKSLLRVRFSDGSHLDCTPDHRFWVSTKFTRKTSAPWSKVQAKDLVKGMATEPFAIRHEHGDTLEDAYTLGVIFGDGRTRKNVAMVDLYGEKMKLPVSGTKSREMWKSGCKTPYIHVRCGIQHVARLNALRADDEDAWWELFSYDRASILSFLAGLFDTDGHNQKCGSVGLSVSGRFRADMVQLLLTKCGIRSTITLSAKAGDETNYGRRSADLWLVSVPDGRGIPCHRIDVSGGRPSTKSGKFQKVVSVEWLPGEHDVYCFTEPEEHKGVFNNSLTFQCEEYGATLTRNLAPFFGDDLIVEVRCPRIDDHEQKIARVNVLVSGGCITKNELRHEMGLPLTREIWGGDIAGTPSQVGSAAMPPPGMAQPGMVPNGPGGEAPQQGTQEQSDPNDPLIALLQGAGDPLTQDTGGLGEGSLGPRQKRFSLSRNGRH